MLTEENGLPEVPGSMLPARSFAPGSCDNLSGTFQSVCFLVIPPFLF